MVVRVAGGKYLWCMVIVAAGWCMVVAAGWCMVAAGGGGCLGGTMVLHHRPVRYGHLSLVPAPTTSGDTLSTLDTVQNIMVEPEYWSQISSCRNKNNNLTSIIVCEADL